MTMQYEIHNLTICVYNRINLIQDIIRCEASGYWHLNVLYETKLQWYRKR